LSGEGHRGFSLRGKFSKTQGSLSLTNVHEESLSFTPVVGNNEVARVLFPGSASSVVPRVGDPDPPQNSTTLFPGESPPVPGSQVDTVPCSTGNHKPSLGLGDSRLLDTATADSSSTTPHTTTTMESTPHLPLPVIQGKTPPTPLESSTSTVSLLTLPITLEYDQSSLSRDRSIIRPIVTKQILFPSLPSPIIPQRD
jgi:hypothetical protein